MNQATIRSTFPILVITKIFEFYEKPNLKVDRSFLTDRQKDRHTKARNKDFSNNQDRKC